MREVPLRTLQRFHNDLHGCHETAIDVDNLSVDEQNAFRYMLSTCIEAETAKVHAEKSEAAHLANLTMLDREMENVDRLVEVYTA